MGLAFALSAGLVTAFNPCGVAMLPAFLSMLLTRGGLTPGRWTMGIRAGLGMTAGFVILFGLAGLAVAGLGQALFVLAPVTSLIVSLSFVAMAIQLWRGRPIRLPGMARLEHGVLQWLRPAVQGSFFVYGISYGLVSLTCSLPVFLAVAATGFHQSLAVGLVRYGVYAAGMGLIVTVLAVLTVVARRVAETTIQALMPLMPKLSAAVLALGSVYLLWYWFGGPGRHVGLL